MSRLTEARIEQWQRRMDKAHAEMSKVLDEARAHYTSAKGGRLTDLGALLSAGREAQARVTDVRGQVANLHAAERRRKGARSSG